MAKNRILSNFNPQVNLENDKIRDERFQGKKYIKWSQKSENQPNLGEYFRFLQINPP